MSEDGLLWSGIIHGEPASKSNSSEICTNPKGKPFIRKSRKALNYVVDAQKQLPRLPNIYEGDVSLTAHIFYATRRPDLDESLIMDALQGFIYKNDRQIKEKHIYHGLDRKHPYVRIEVRAL